MVVRASHTLVPRSAMHETVPRSTPIRLQILRSSCKVTLVKRSLTIYEQYIIYSYKYVFVDFPHLEFIATLSHFPLLLQCIAMFSPVQFLIFVFRCYGTLAHYTTFPNATFCTCKTAFLLYLARADACCVYTYRVYIRAIQYLIHYYFSLPLHNS